MTLIPAPERPKQADLYEFETNLVYKTNFRLVGVTYEILSQTKQNKTQKHTLMRLIKYSYLWLQYL